MKQLKELTVEELKALYKSNEQFSNKVYEQVYEGNMYFQSEEYEAIFGKNNRTVEYHDHYTSFYLTVKDHEQFIHTLEGRDIMTVAAQELYDKAEQLVAEWEEMTWDEQQENDELWEKIEQTDNELVQELTDRLRDYERVEDQQIEDELTAIHEGITYMSEWETDGEKVYEHITKVYR